ncbi:hypothetical protein [Flagellimonas sp.]|uniref:hypothetical protein n=1 Tax=Flagellimonas sp. TaxID=2058762 RepID=UPI003BAA8E02
MDLNENIVHYGYDAKNGHGIPPKTEKSEHSKITNKILTYNLVQRNIGWFNFAVFSGSHNPSHAP